MYTVQLPTTGHFQDVLAMAFGTTAERIVRVATLMARSTSSIEALAAGVQSDTCEHKAANGHASGGSKRQRSSSAEGDAVAVVTVASQAPRHTEPSEQSTDALTNTAVAWTYQGSTMRASAYAHSQVRHHLAH